MDSFFLSDAVSMSTKVHSQRQVKIGDYAESCRMVHVKIKTCLKKNSFSFH